MKLGDQIQYPVQVMLQTDQFIQLNDRIFGGSHKDFFANNDAGFEQHKLRLRKDIRNVAEKMIADDQPSNFLVVQMREKALAKSYRPISALFTPSNNFALVGGGKLGEMFFQCTPQGLFELDNRIEERAELTPRNKFNEKTQMEETRVSRIRSELGGINTIRLLSAADRLSFSAQTAIEWFRQPKVVSGYIVELFQPNLRVQSKAIEQEINNFKSRISKLSGGILVMPLLFRNLSEINSAQMTYSIQLLNDTSDKHVFLPSVEQISSNLNFDKALEILRRELNYQEYSIDRHQELLDFLSAEPLVRSIELPPQINIYPTNSSRKIDGNIPPPDPSRSYPVVGIVDGGVAGNTAIGAWKEDAAGNIMQNDRDEYHGTFISGLLAGGGHLNPKIQHTVEPYGCRFYDLDVLPRQGLFDDYYSSLPEFLDQLDTLIEKAKIESQVRVFNISLGVDHYQVRSEYSFFAAHLDEIARKLDVLFVVSAGNLDDVSSRPPWPVHGPDAIAMLATQSSGLDRILPPAEHLLGLTVGAVNPPGVSGHEENLPTTYTRRGPGVGFARKPDLCHYGGCAVTNNNSDSGLYSLESDGRVVGDCGTSFATPLVAATVAAIDHALDGRATRETLLALPVHRAQRTDNLQHPALKFISRDFVGFGMPSPAENCLSDGPHSITLVFSDWLKPNSKLEFDFNWPESLTAPDGKCRGNAKLTLAFTPTIDQSFRAECLRVMLEATLSQLEFDQNSGEIIPKSRLKLEDSELSQNLHFSEHFLVKNGLKWTPIKRYSLSMPRGRGTSGAWRLSVKSTTRAGAKIPMEGIAFTLIMTLSDELGTAPIYNEVRNDFVQRGLELADITAANRLRV